MANECANSIAVLNIHFERVFGREVRIPFDSRRYACSVQYGCDVVLSVRYPDELFLFWRLDHC